MVPDTVNASDPTLVNEPKAVLTAPSVYTCDDRSVPLNVVAVLLLPAVNVIPGATSTRPAPAIEAMVSATSTSYTPLVPTLTAVLVPSDPVTFNRSLVIVILEIVLVPDNVNVDAPVLANVPAPSKVPAYVLSALVL